MDVFDEAERVAVSRIALRWVHRPLMEMGPCTGRAISLLCLPPDGYLGVEPTPEMTNEARARYPVHVFLTDAPCLAYGLTCRFASVISLFGAVAVADFPAVVARVRNVLAPGGAFFLMLNGRKQGVGGDCCSIPWVAAVIGEAGLQVEVVRGFNVFGEHHVGVFSEQALSSYLEWEFAEPSCQGDGRYVIAAGRRG